jgi:hypothetical protein
VYFIEFKVNELSEPGRALEQIKQKNTWKNIMAGKPGRLAWSLAIQAAISAGLNG